MKGAGRGKEVDRVGLRSLGKWGGDSFGGYREVKRGGIGMWMERRKLCGACRERKEGKLCGKVYGERKKRG